MEQIVADAAGITLVVRTCRQQAVCPDCDQPTKRVHTWYTRELADLPWQGLAVRLRLHTRRWFCDHPACSRSIFTERLPGGRCPTADGRPGWRPSCWSSG